VLEIKNVFLKLSNALENLKQVKLIKSAWAILMLMF
jgi:hypothetical protein